MDDFTLKHLQTYVDECIFDHDREPFLAWALAQLAEDPGLADYGWPSLYRTWMYDRVEHSNPQPNSLGEVS